MKKVDVFEICMKLTGRLTQIPDSQKIFGSMIYHYAERNSDEQAAALVRKIRKGQLYCAISNMLPQGYMPMTQVDLTVVDTSSPDKIDLKTLHEEQKKRAYIQEKDLKEVMEYPKKIAELYPSVKVKELQQIHAVLDSHQYNLPGLDPNLYSVPEVQVVEVRKDDKDEKECNLCQFVFYMAIENGPEENELYKMLQEAKEEEGRFFLGPRTSQGMNTYVVERIEKKKEEKCMGKRYLNMGMLLPDRIDYDRSTLRLFTSERRPYNMSAGWEKSDDRMVISFIEAGSIIYPKIDIFHTGRSVASPFDARAIVFGNAFLYPLFNNEMEG